eukprot:g10422.t1 g10422   contig4:1849285-1852582(-)
MPLALQETYVVLSCLCELYQSEEWGFKGCCTVYPNSSNDHIGIRTTGAAPGESLTKNQKDYFTYVCGTMSETLDSIGVEIVAPPTSSPTKGDVVVTGQPTARPSTRKPTAQPSSKRPTKAPVVATDAPTLKPSPSVTAESKEPSASPVSTVSSMPTGVVTETLPPVPPTTPSPVSSSPVEVSSSPTTTRAPIEPTASPAPSSSVSPTTETKSPSFATPFPTIVPITPTVSPMPTVSSEPSAPTVAPSSSPVEPTSSPVESVFTGDVPVPINFVESLQGEVTAEQVIEGTTNQVKDMLQESLVELSDIVIEEQFGGNLRVRRRQLIVEEAVNATVESAKDVECPAGLPSNATEGSACISFYNIIVLSLVDETDTDGSVETFQAAMNEKIQDGWLVDNFNLTKALEPPPEPSPPPTSNPSSVDDNKEVKVNTLPMHAGEDEFDLERQEVTNSAAARDGLDPSEGVDDSWSVDDSAANTESNTSQDHLLAGQLTSSANTPALGTLEDEEDWSESDMDSSCYDSSSLSTGPPQDSAAFSSTLAAVGMASTLVASSATAPESASAASSTAESGGILGAFSPQSDGGLDGTVDGIGAAGALTAGALAAGAYAATRTPRKEEDVADDAGRALDTTPASNLDELDNAIESGNWGAVGALAAILASEGRGVPLEKKNKSVSSIKSEDSTGRSSRGSSTGPGTLDQARAAEIDKLVENGDWQGVVLAAARFEADQTMDGESYSASASRSSKWSGSSARSSATPRSLATTDQSSANMGSGRSQAEIKAEVEALVRRVVPEEADNVDEMLTQFKGREEELVETLRRMQERAIASRARLAVQKSAKLEARARTTSPAPGSASVASRGSTKSELEIAIESGNWAAVGEAAKKISDGSVGSFQDYNLDTLIERGDWPGVIAAAKKASEGTPGRSLADNMTQEEQDALAQASMWQEIANQSKSEGRQDAAGAAAADWAISRSLNALNSPQDGPVRTIHDIADEESSEASQYESSSYSASRSHGQDDQYYRGVI